VDPAFARQSLLSGGRAIVRKEGPSALLTGFGPTAVGYFVQGGAKFAGYEFWKKRFVSTAGDKDTAVRYRTAIYLGAASVGESVSSSCDCICIMIALIFPTSVLAPPPGRRLLGCVVADSLRTSS
jgi:hypothetical protein